MKVFQGRKKRTDAASSKAAASVDAMLAIYMSKPGVLLTDMPSGDRLKSIAADALSGHGTATQLAAGAYVRAIQTNGARPLDDQEKMARRDASNLMSDLLKERHLSAAKHETEVWSEALSPKVRVLWVAAVKR